MRPQTRCPEGPPGRRLKTTGRPRHIDTFDAGGRKGTIKVPVLPALDGTGEQSLTLRLSNARNAVIDDGMATGEFDQPLNVGLEFGPMNDRIQLATETLFLRGDIRS